MSRTPSTRCTRSRVKLTEDYNNTIASSSVVTPTKSELLENPITPRRSTRKSVKPNFDYMEIISSTSASKKTKNLDEDHWDPVVVGRFSEKRSKKRHNKKKVATNKDNSSSDENNIENISLSLFSPIKEEKIMQKLIKTEELIKEEETIKDEVEKCIDTENSNEKNSEQEKEINELNSDQKIVENFTEKEENPESISVAAENSKSFDEVINDEKIVIEELENIIIEDSIEKNFKVNEEVTDEIETSQKVPKVVIKESDLDLLDLGLSPLDDEPSTEIEKLTFATMENEQLKTPVLSDNIESPDVEEVQQTLNTTFDASDCIIISPTSDSDEKVLKIPNIIITSPNSSVTQTITAKTPRIATPFKPKLQNKPPEEHLNSISDDENCEPLSVSSDVIVEKNIRKRSNTISVDVRGLATANKTKHHVTFCSPANQTTIIYDSDEENIKKVPESSFITKRRRRSKSLDESSMLKPAIKHRLTPMKAQGSRIKLPDFAAIHKKHFAKMENIVDHVARKAERAKVLVSATKKPRVAVTSEKKTQTPGRFGRLSTFEKEKPKVSRKIELAQVTDLDMKNDFKKILQHSRIPIIIPTPAVTMTPPVIRKKAASVEPESHKYLHKIKSKTINRKPLGKSTFSKSAVDITVAAMKSLKNTELFTFKKREDRIAGFKENKEDKKQKNNDEIRGVRLNRCYLLQMEHRRNMKK